eukprot:1890037-Prymnesium_polylepis.1
MHAQHERTHAQHERDSHQVRQAHTRSRRPAALSAAAQCCQTRSQHPLACPQHDSPMLPSPR